MATYNELLTLALKVSRCRTSKMRPTPGVRGRRPLPPEGTRGMFTKGAAAEFGAHGYSTVGELTAAINADIVCNPIIEDVEGVANIDEILAVPGSTSSRSGLVTSLVLLGCRPD